MNIDDLIKRYIRDCEVLDLLLCQEGLDDDKRKEYLQEYQIKSELIKFLQRIA
jgi:hypothetical protein